MSQIDSSPDLHALVIAFDGIIQAGVIRGPLGTATAVRPGPRRRSPICLARDADLPTARQAVDCFEPTLALNPSTGRRLIFSRQAIRVVLEDRKEAVRRVAKAIGEPMRRSDVAGLRRCTGSRKGTRGLSAAHQNLHNWQHPLTREAK